MKYNDIKNLKLDELGKKRRELNEELFGAQMKNSLGQLSNPLTIRFIRRDIAKVNTAIQQKIQVS